MLSPVEILQNLIRFDTTNPPGNERPCILYIRDLLAEAGIEASLYSRTSERPNLLARLPGNGQAPPLLLYGHVDVVTTTNQPWQVPPFEGRIQDGYVWGRGAVDMKGPLTLFLSAFLKAKKDQLSLPGDLLFLALADEEAGGDFGAKFLVESCPDLFKDVRYAFGEFGGFNLSLLGKRFYPIMISEKQICGLKATFRGPGGHGSMPIQGGAMARLADALKALDRRSLPIHITEPVRWMIHGLADGLGGAYGLILRQLVNPVLANQILASLGERSRLFSPLLRNTASPTILSASDKINVIPCEVHLNLDGRLLPGATPEDLLAELGAILGQDCELQVLAYDPGPSSTDNGHFETLASTLRQLDPQGIPIPYVLSGVTDARFFSRLGIQTYGFTPLHLPEDFSFVETVHAADERLPLAALDFGIQAVTTAIQQMT